MATNTDATTAGAVSNGDANAARTLTEESRAKSSAAKRRKAAVRVARKYNHLYAIHSTSRPSCLSYQDTKETPDFWGFRNLMVLMLIVSNLRLMIENFRKYGVLICITCHDYNRSDVRLGLLLYVSIPLHLIFAYLIELIAASRAKVAVARLKRDESSRDHNEHREFERRNFRTAWYMIAFAHGVNATLNLVISTIVVYYYIHHPGIGTACELHAVIVWLKTCSYAFTNRDLRDALLSPDAYENMPEIYKSCPYPQNVSLRNLMYFWWAPTLVYQPVYPRTSHVRWLFVVKRLAECAGLCIVIWFASAQYAVPLLTNSLDHVHKLDVVSIAERVLKLSTISLACWLAGFFALFQSFLNALAELLRFADREFYSDWWNVASIRTYWTSWNKPVYHFMRRHIYAPIVARGVPPALAQIIVFVFSGVLHELLVGVPTHNIIGMAFLGMLWQIPLIAMTDPVTKYTGYGGRVFGNMIFWVSFCIVGQPLAVMSYYYAWQAKYGNIPSSAGAGKHAG